MNRPTGVSVVAVLLWLTGVVNVINGVSSMSLSGLWGTIQLIIGLAAIAFGVGLWQMQEWAWAGTLVLMGLNAISLIAFWIQYGRRVRVSGVILPLVVNIIVIIYLLQPDVRAAFRRQRSA
jgi:hypothetical protein